jgi:HSP20 family protein
MADESKAMETRKQEAVSPYEERTRQRPLFVPRADIYETEDDIVVVADVPGTDENNVEITLEKNILTINAYPSNDPPKDFTVVYSEYGLGDYQRRFAISNEIDRDKIEAQVKDGVLRLRLPKAGPSKTRKITVKAG